MRESTVGVSTSRPLPVVCSSMRINGRTTLTTFSSKMIFQETFRRGANEVLHLLKYVATSFVRVRRLEVGEE